MSKLMGIVPETEGSIILECEDCSMEGSDLVEELEQKFDITSFIGDHGNVVDTSPNYEEVRMSATASQNTTAQRSYMNNPGALLVEKVESEEDWQPGDSKNRFIKNGCQSRVGEKLFSGSAEERWLRDRHTLLTGRARLVKVIKSKLQVLCDRYLSEFVFCFVKKRLRQRDQYVIVGNGEPLARLKTGRSIIERELLEQYGHEQCRSDGSDKAVQTVPCRDLAQTPKIMEVSTQTETSTPERFTVSTQTESSTRLENTAADVSLKAGEIIIDIPQAIMRENEQRFPGWKTERKPKCCLESFTMTPRKHKKMNNSTGCENGSRIRSQNQSAFSPTCRSEESQALPRRTTTVEEPTISMEETPAVSVARPPGTKGCDEAQTVSSTVIIKTSGKVAAKDAETSTLVIKLTQAKSSAETIGSTPVVKMSPAEFSRVVKPCAGARMEKASQFKAAVHATAPDTEQRSLPLSEHTTKVGVAKKSSFSRACRRGRLQVIPQITTSIADEEPSVPIEWTQASVPTSPSASGGCDEKQTESPAELPQQSSVESDTDSEPMPVTISEPEPSSTVTNDDTCRPIDNCVSVQKFTTKTQRLKSIFDLDLAQTTILGESAPTTSTSVDKSCDQIHVPVLTSSVKPGSGIRKSLRRTKTRAKRTKVAISSFLKVMQSKFANRPNKATSVAAAMQIMSSNSSNDTEGCPETLSPTTSMTSDSSVSPAISISDVSLNDGQAITIAQDPSLQPTVLLPRLNTENAQNDGDVQNPSTVDRTDDSRRSDRSGQRSVGSAKMGKKRGLTLSAYERVFQMLQQEISRLKAEVHTEFVLYIHVVKKGVDQHFLFGEGVPHENWKAAEPVVGANVMKELDSSWEVPGRVPQTTKVSFLDVGLPYKSREEKQRVRLKFRTQAEDEKSPNMKAKDPHTPSNTGSLGLDPSIENGQSETMAARLLRYQRLIKRIFVQLHKLGDCFGHEFIFYMSRHHKRSFQHVIAGYGEPLARLKSGECILTTEQMQHVTIVEPELKSPKPKVKKIGVDLFLRKTKRDSQVHETQSVSKSTPDDSNLAVDPSSKLSVSAGTAANIHVDKVLSCDEAVPESTPTTCTKDIATSGVSRAESSEASDISRSECSDASDISRAVCSETSDMSRTVCSEASDISLAVCSEASDISRAIYTENILCATSICRAHQLVNTKVKTKDTAAHCTVAEKQSPHCSKRKIPATHSETKRRKSASRHALSPDRRSTQSTSDQKSVDEQTTKPGTLSTVQDQPVKLSSEDEKSSKLPVDGATDKYELEIFRLSSKSHTKKEAICRLCEKPTDLIQCKGACNATYHPVCLGLTEPHTEIFTCAECSSGCHTCFICKEATDETQRCSAPRCDRYYHAQCLPKFKQVNMTSNSTTVCSLHACATCALNSSGPPAVTKGLLYKCVRCPTAYHVGDLCIAAGCIRLAGLNIVCSKHFRPIKSQTHHAHINVDWCFVCSKGGTLLCCESCPAAFHADCLRIDLPSGKWFCADCCRGKRPRYGEIVWVKVGNYRWWPAEICLPQNVPQNIQNKVHQAGEFPVRFFGSYDYLWTHQGRVMLFQDGDRGSRETAGTSYRARLFNKAMSEVTTAHKTVCTAKAEREKKEQERSARKPAPYKHVKTNIPIGSVVIHKVDVYEVPHCNCGPDDKNPCGVNSECLNQAMMYECHPVSCPAKERCQNQRFAKRLYPACQPSKVPGHGWGLQTLEDIKKGSFIHEYVGDLVDEEECRRRIKDAHDNDISNFYMLTLDKNRTIDAGPKGNLSRFMNHSCRPNCETQKWTVMGDVRVGLFAKHHIQKGSELTFNYNLECLGNEKKVCHCGAANCSGFLGVPPKVIPGEDAVKKTKTKRKRFKLNKGTADHGTTCVKVPTDPSMNGLPLENFKKRNSAITDMGTVEKAPTILTHEEAMKLLVDTSSDEEFDGFT